MIVLRSFGKCSTIKQAKRRVESRHIICVNTRCGSVSILNKRTGNAVATLAVGLALNIILGAAKLTIGLLSTSSSVVSDAVNNISDAAVSLVTIIATCLAARGADYDHPYGHGRYEHIAAFILGAVIVAVGAEVFISGIRRAVEPVEIVASTALWATLGASIAVKGFMAVFYFMRGKRVGSDTLKAAAVDSVSDVAVTTVVLVCAIAEKFTAARIDGYVSMAVAVVITVFGVRILKQTVSRLLGERPDPQLYGTVKRIIESAPQVLSVHDIMINDYGAGNMTAEADAVFPADMAFVDVHAVCDGIERKVREDTGVRLCVHADPLNTGDARLSAIAEKLKTALTPFGATAHDVSVDDDKHMVELDIMLASDKLPTDEITAIAESQVRAVVQYNVKVRIDYI